MEPQRPRRYTPIEEIPRIPFDRSRATTEPEAFWEWPGMFWRWSTGPIRRASAALRARAQRS
jgi:hypothetical protein